MKKVKVKFLKFVGEYKAGDVVELDEALAEQLCKVSEMNDGHGVISHQKAILMSEVEKFEENLVLGKVDMSKISQHELKELGIKYREPTPKDPAFEAKLEALSKPASDGFDEFNDSEGMEDPAKEKQKKKGK